MNCPSCHRQIPTNDSSCTSCGFSFDDATRRLGSKEPPLANQREKESRSSTSFDSIDNARFVPGMILAERYRIVGLLGKGGMGEVYRADDLKLGQPVALKFLPENLLSDGAALARFHREVRLARQVSHKNVCRVYDIGEVDGRQFLSMEFIKGEELSSLLHRIGRLPSDKAIQIARQICAGLEAAHEGLFENFLTKLWIPELLPKVHEKLTAGGEVADVGCGAGRALIKMAQAYPQSNFAGYEPDRASASRAKNLVKQEKLEGRARIFNMPSSNMPNGQYDFVTTFDVVHDLANPQSLIEDVRRALRADGTYLMMEANCSHRLEENLHPVGKLLYSLSTLYCLPFSLADKGAGIGTCMGEELPRQMCDKAGFSHSGARNSMSFIVESFHNLVCCSPALG